MIDRFYGADYDRPGQIAADPVRIFGEIVTDGTIGEIRETNLVSWSFTILDATSSGTFSSFSSGAVAALRLFAAADSLRSFGFWSFENVEASADGRQIRQMFRGGDYGHVLVDDFRAQVDPLTGFDVISPTGAYATAGGVPAFLGTAVSSVPVPGSLLLLITGLAALGVAGFVSSAATQTTTSRRSWAPTPNTSL